MKILVLGSMGNLGTQLVETFLADEKYEVLGWDRKDIDITQKETAFEKIKEVSPDVIINATAYNAVDRCEDDEEEFKLAKKLNTQAPVDLARIAQQLNAIFVHYSSDYVFSGEDRTGYDETAKQNPINRYGLSKAEGEKEIVRLAFSGLKWYIIRTSKLFGPRGASELAKPSFFDIMLDLAEKKEQIEVVDEEKSCFTYTPDLAFVTRDIIAEQPECGIYHVTNSETATWYEACKTLFEITETDKEIVPISSDKFPRPARRPKFSQLLNTKIKPLRSYRNALEEYLKK